MPRLPRALIRQAAVQHPLLPLLLRICRDIGSAQNELRWLQEHARDTVPAKKRRKHDHLLPGGASCIDLSAPPRSHVCKDPLGHASGPTQGSRSCSRNGEEQAWKDKWTSIDEEHPVLRDIRLSSGVPRRYPLQKRSVRRGPNYRPGRGQSSDSTSTLREAPSDRRTEIKVHTQRLLTRYVTRRARGVPLQYILGSQPFGNLDILTRKGVLVPRPETETYTEDVGKLLLSWLGRTTSRSKTWPAGRKRLRILDLCSGTGCIALLVHSILKAPDSDMTSTGHVDLKILGVDISRNAILLANRNLQHNIAHGLLHPEAAQDISFRQMDMLPLASLNKPQMMRRLLEMGDPDDDGDPGSNIPWDVIISNPPYISPRDYGPGGKTEASVRKYEPSIALVPPTSVSGPLLDNNPATDPGDLFYGPLMDLMKGLGARLLVMEVGDSQQAGRVHEIALQKFGSVAFTGNGNHALLVESWKDDGTERLLLPADTTPDGNSSIGSETVPGAAHGFTATVDSSVSDRAVVIWRGDLAEWQRSKRWAG